MKSSLEIRSRYIAGEVYLTTKLRYCFILSRRGFTGGLENMVEIEHRGRETWAGI